MQSTNLKRCLEIQMPIRVRTYDIDSAGHVSNIAYLRWMEDMRLQIFIEHFSLESLMQKECTPVLANTYIVYKKPIKLFDNPVGYMWISHLGSASLKFEGEILVDGTVTTTVSHTGVFVDSTTMRPVKLPKMLVEKFREAEDKL